MLPRLLLKGVLFVGKCIIYGDSAWKLCRAKAQWQLPIAACTNLAPNIHPSKPDLRLTDPSVELLKSSEQSLTSFSVSEF